MPSIDIDIDDFLWNCTSSEIGTLIEYLIKDGYDTEMINKLNKHKKFVQQGPEEMDEYLIKIQNSQIQLTLEEENIIKLIANRLV